MKLIRCYIENFGGLQQYTVDFQDGLTVIHEPNGFGKTTLAEFIRAMFYGFPRGGKDLSKNLRQKYAPWQGGRYGGYLIFEHNDKRYRIDRSFGDAPKGDKFKLFNEDTHKEVKDYSADIGTELFGLDADSFLRSTYMPQQREGGALTTDNIRAKLGNLLEDTGDMGSYEKALQRLKDKRVTYERYRGAGGSIYEAQVKITELQQQIDDCTAKGPQLEELTEELTVLRKNRDLGEGALERIRRELSDATTAEAEASLSREYEKLRKEQKEAAEALAALTAKYPKGLPSNEALTAAESRMDRAAALEAQHRETAVDRNAEETAAKLKHRFAEGVPTAEDFSKYRATADRLVTAISEKKAAALTEDETEQLAQLQQQFAQGIPTEEMLQDCKAQITELTELQLSRKTLEMSREDRDRLSLLSEHFPTDVPTEAELEQAEQKLNRADALRRSNLQLTAAMPSEPPAPPAPQKKFHSLFFPALILGILAAAGAVCLLTMPQLLEGTPLFDHHTVIGGICAALAVIAIIAAAFLQNNHSIMSKLQTQAPAGGISPAQRSLMEENERTAAALEAEVLAFLSSYPSPTEEALRSRLGDLSTNRALYLPLLERSEVLCKQAAENDSRTAQLTEALHKALSPYFDTVLSFDHVLQTLSRRIEQYGELSRKKDDMLIRSLALTAEIAALEDKLTAFLRRYGVTDSDYRQASDTLRRDADSYTAAEKHLQQRTEALAARDKELGELQEAHDAFCNAYALTLPMGDRQALKAAERDVETVSRLNRELTEVDKALADFVTEHGHKPASALKPVSYDLEGLKLGEAELLRKQNDRNRDILTKEQRCKQLRADLDRIPELTDALARVTEQKAADTESCRLLDSTVDFLQKARESLSASYLGGVQGHFAKYLNRLTGEDLGHIAVNTDLEVQLERAGSARPLVHFSAGQNDAVHLCMRLALSDALFEDESCFMILDDPFVNLDDHHTAQALALLRDLAEDRQIVYLVCNQSRAI